MGRKVNSLAFYQIDNLFGDDEFKRVYDYVLVGMRNLEKVAKRNLKTRNFQIEEMWSCKFENSVATFNSTKKAGLINGSFEFDLKRIFECAGSVWRYDRDVHEEMNKLCYSTSTIKGYSYRLHKNKMRWYYKDVLCSVMAANKIWNKERERQGKKFNDYDDDYFMDDF